MQILGEFLRPLAEIVNELEKVELGLRVQELLVSVRANIGHHCVELFHHFVASSFSEKVLGEERSPICEHCVTSEVGQTGGNYTGSLVRVTAKVSLHHFQSFLLALLLDDLLSQPIEVHIFHGV